MHICMRLRIYARIYAYMNAYTHICTPICIYARIYVYMHAYTHICARIRIYARAYAYMQASTHIGTEQGTCGVNNSAGLVRSLGWRDGI